MYLGHSRRRKDGKSHVYWRLVRCVRRGGKVVQETVAHLGELDGEDIIGSPRRRTTVVSLVLLCFVSGFIAALILKRYRQA